MAKNINIEILSLVPGKQLTELYVQLRNTIGLAKRLFQVFPKMSLDEEKNMKKNNL